MNREKTIDYLKAFSIVLVVFYHSLFSSGLCWSNMSYICLIITLKNVHVPMFIVIAGYLCRPQEIKKFYIKKTERIFIPFIFMSCLKLLCSFLITEEYAHGEGIMYQLYDAFICGNLYWYCYCLLVIFLLVPLIWKNKRRKWIVLAAFTVLNLILYYTGTEVTDILQLTQVIYFIPLFTAGMLLKDYSAFAYLNSIFKRVILLAASLAASGICIYLRLVRDISNIYILDVMLGISIMSVLYFIAVSIEKIRVFRFLDTLGKYSYQIMLLDSLYRIAIFYLLGKFMEKGIVMAFAATILDLFLSCITCMIVQKIPGLSFVMGLKRIKH